MAIIYTGKFYESRKTGYEYELVITADGYVLDDGEGYAFEVSPTYKDDLETVKNAFEVSPTYKDDLETVKNAFGEKFDEVSE